MQLHEHAESGTWPGMKSQLSSATAASTPVFRILLRPNNIHRLTSIHQQLRALDQAEQEKDQKRRATYDCVPSNAFSNDIALRGLHNALCMQV
jgi:hypothetical protein